MALGIWRAGSARCLHPGGSQRFLPAPGRRALQRTARAARQPRTYSDRNGLILASSVPSPSIWAIPEDVEHDKAQLRKLAKLLGMSEADLSKKFDDEDKTFVWVKRQVDEATAKQVAGNIKGIYQRKEYRREYPEGESAVHVVGFTNVETSARKALSWPSTKTCRAVSGSRRVIKDRLGRGGGHRRHHFRSMATTSNSASTAKYSFRLPGNCATQVDNKARRQRGGAGCAVTGEVLAWPTTPAIRPTSVPTWWASSCATVP